MANASLILFVSLVVLTAAKPFNDLADTYERFVENPQPRGIQYRVPLEYQRLYDRVPEVYPRQEYPRVLYQPFASIPEELYNGDILQRQSTEEREVGVVIPKEQKEDVRPVEQNSAPEEKPSQEDKNEKEAPNHEQPEDRAEEPQQRPDDEKEQPKDDKHDDKHDDRAEPEHKPHPRPNPRSQKPGKEGGRPHGKPERKQGKGHPIGPRRPRNEPEQKDRAIEPKRSEANPKPDTPLVQINVQVASL